MESKHSEAMHWEAKKIYCLSKKNCILGVFSPISCMGSRSCFSFSLPYFPLLYYVTLK
jgi:hypothetical protein